MSPTLLPTLFVSFLMAGLSMTSSSMPLAVGFWVSDKGDSIIEMTESKIIVSSSTNNQDSLSFEYEKINATTYQLKGISNKANEEAPTLLIDNNSLTLVMTSPSNKDVRKEYTKAPSISTSDIMGVWYDIQKIDDEEIITLATQKIASYDYEIITLDHKNNTYQSEKDIDVKFILEKGFIFTDTNPDNDPSTDDDYIYYLTLANEKTVSFIDTNGDKWSQNKLTDKDLVSIPENYTPLNKNTRE